MALKAQKDKPSRKHRASKSGLTKTDGGIDGLHQSAASFGAATCYVDDGGVRRQVTDQSLSRILAVMGVQVETPEEVRLSLRESRSGRWRELVDRVMVVRVDRLPNTFAVRLPVDLDELRRPSLVSGRSVALRYSGNLAHCSRTPPYPLFIHPSSLEALNIPARITRHECWMSGSFLCSSNVRARLDGLCRSLHRLECVQCESSFFLLRSSVF